MNVMAQSPNLNQDFVQEITCGDISASSTQHISSELMKLRQEWLTSKSSIIGVAYARALIGAKHGREAILVCHQLQRMQQQHSSGEPLLDSNVLQLLTNEARKMYR